MLKYLLAMIFLIVSFWGKGQDSTNNATRRFLEELEKKQKSLTGQMFPPFKVQLNGKTFSNSRLANKVSLVNFWFAGCKPCLLEFNALNKLNEKLGGNENFQIISFTGLKTLV